MPVCINYIIIVICRKTAPLAKSCDVQNPVMSVSLRTVGEEGKQGPGCYPVGGGSVFGYVRE